MEIEMASIKLISQFLSVAYHVGDFNAWRFAVIVVGNHQPFPSLSSAHRRQSNISGGRVRVGIVKQNKFVLWDWEDVSPR